MVRKKIRSQMITALIHIIESLVLMIICAYCSIGVYRDGAGTRGKNYGLKKTFADWIYQMEDQGNDTLVKLILWAMFGLAAIAALFALIYFLLHLTPGRTRLGRSIRQQAASYEKLSDLIEMIQTDMAQEVHTFGTELRIGSQWILGEEAMRLNRIRRIAVKESWEIQELMITDLNQNQMSVLFSSKEDLEQAACYLQKKLPEVPVEGLPKEIAVPNCTYKTAQRNEDNKMETTKLMSWHITWSEEDLAEMKEAAEQGNPAAQTEYGKCLLFGKGMTADPDAACQLFKQAASQESEIAKMYLGHCLLYGIGTEKEESKGYKMLDDALNYNYPSHGSSQTQAGYSTFQEEDLCQLFWDLGDALENSLGVVRNYRIACYYYNMLNDWGHPEGADRRANFKKFLFFYRKIH